MNKLQQNIRVNVIDLAKLFSSDDDFREFQLRVPHVLAPTELFCKWFDDTYMPQDTDFIAAFSLREHHAINSFSARLDKLSLEAGDPPPPIEALFNLPSWTGVKQHACKCFFGNTCCLIRRSGRTVRYE